jgi:hypothetical protein
MQCATTILSKTDEIKHEYTLTADELERAVKRGGGFPEDSVIAWGREDGRMTAVIHIIVKRGRKE